MRVLFLTHRLPYAPNRGDRIRAYHLLRSLTGMATVDLLSLTHDEEEARHATELERDSVRVWTAPVNRVRNFAGVPVALLGGRPLTHVMLSSPSVITTLRTIVEKTPPDVVLAYCSGMARFAMGEMLSNVPCVLDMVDVDSEKWASLAKSAAAPMRQVYAREAKRLREFERRASDQAVATTVVNDRERTAMLAVNPSARVVTVPNGVDLGGFRPHDEPGDSQNVVFCGVFSYEPNESGAIWFAREVWPLVRKVRPGAHLTLVGMGPGRRVRSLAEDASIEVTGAVPDVRPYLWQSAVAIAPLHVARGLQNKVLEALASGLPCIVTPAVAAGLPVDVRSACDVAADPETFARHVVNVLDLSPQARRRRALDAPLTALEWQRQLQPMMGLLAAAPELAAARR